VHLHGDGVHVEEDAPISLKVLMVLLAISLALVFIEANDSAAEAMGSD